MVNAAEVTRAEQLQPVLISQLKRVIKNKELAHAYLLVGPSGSGKETVARWLALRLFCLHPVDGEPDGTCPECQRILSENHPDIVLAQAEGRQIKVDTIRRLKSEFTKSAMEGNKKLFIIKDAEKMTTSAANSLLKFIEEPGPGIYILMLTTNKSAILPTIQSRTQVLEMAPLNRQELLSALQELGVTEKKARIAIGLTDSVTTVVDWCQDGWFDQAVSGILQWYHQVSQGKMMAFVGVQTDLVKLGVHSRDHQLVLLDLAALIWRDTLLAANGITDQDRFHFVEELPAIKSVGQHYSMADLLTVSQLTLATRHYLEQNISFQNIFEELTIRIVQTLTD